MGMIAHHTGNLLEFESSCTRPLFTHQTRKTSQDSSTSSTSSSTVPELILSISLQSFTESDDTDTASLDDTLSWGSTSEQPGARGSPVVRTRSIFSSYWSSPAHVINYDSNSYNEVDDLEILERMRTLKMPTVGIVSVDDPAGEEEPLSKIHHPTRPLPTAEVKEVPRRPTIDDDVVNYRPSINRSQSTPIINRRRILPPPPPPKVIPQSPSMTRLSSLARSSQSQQSPRNELAPYGKRPWSSTTALLVGSNDDQDDNGGLPFSNVVGPSPQSCLRKPRYSLSGQDLASVAAEATTSNDDNNDNTSSSTNFVRSVSFYSEVRVVEYNVPVERRSQDGWSKYFIGQVE